MFRYMRLLTNQLKSVNNLHSAPKRLYTELNVNSLGVKFESDYSKEQQNYLLNILNNSSQDELLRFNLSKNRIKKIDTWKRKHGSFKTLTDVLEVDGLSVKMLNRLCKTIIDSENNETDTKTQPFKTRGQLLTPLLSSLKLKELKSSLGIYLFSTGISWVKMETENNLVTDWDFFNYNLSGKKLSPTEALQIVLQASEEIPHSDVYVFEAPMAVTPTAQQSPVSVVAYAQRVQLLSILMTVLSTSPTHNPTYFSSIMNKNENSIQLEPNVYFLRHRVPARMFQTLVGNEKVSVENTVSNILKNDKPDKLYYSPIRLADDLQVMYNHELPVNKEVLGQALLLNMAFLDLCVYQNHKSLSMLSAKRRT